MKTAPLINLPFECSPITDADEEIFLLYTALNQMSTKLVGPDGYRGLGHIDSRKDSLTIQFELQSRASSAPGAPRPTKKSKRKAASRESSTRVVEVEIAQDPTALRSRNGDTGSVVWRASTELAKEILQQYFFPSDSSIFNRDRLAVSHCLELGAGTGLFGLLVAPLVGGYTITDIGPLLPLIQKNVSLNSHRRSDGSSSAADPRTNITIEELDWLALASLPSGTARARYCPLPKLAESTDPGVWDLVFAIDCIYNPFLLPALVDTIDVVSTSGRTWVLVVAELRQEDVLREFLELWLKKGSVKWVITRLEGLLDGHFVVWAGQKRLGL